MPGCALHPRSRVQFVQKKAHTSIQVQRRHSDIPCAMVLRLISCSPRRTGLVVTVASRTLPRHLTPASGRQDHTTSPYVQAALVSRNSRVHCDPSLVRDDGQRPSERDGMAIDVK
jgi:hypothetical protein